MEESPGPGAWDTGSRAKPSGTQRRGGAGRSRKTTRIGASRTAGQSRNYVLRNNKVTPDANGQLRQQEGSRRRLHMSGEVVGGDERTVSAKAKAQMSTSAKAEKDRLKYRSSRYMIDPRDPFMRKWDLVSVILLCFAAIVTPYEVAFLEVKYFSTLWWINRVIDAFFFCDLILNFNLIYFDEKTHCFVTNRPRVVERYLKGFFFIDLVSITPFRELSVLLGGSGAANFNLIRIVRIIRLAKLLRILRGSRIFQRFENQLTISYGLLRLYKFLLLVLVLCHWLACLWNLVRRIERARCNWAANYFTDSPCLNHVDDSIDTTPLQTYVVSFYLAVMTTSTVGYGDVSPVTDGERLCLVFAMLLGASVYAYVVGNICDIMGTLNQRESEFQEMMDSVNRFIKDSSLSKDLAAQIRAFFRYRRNATDMSRYIRIISTLSPQMRGAVALELNSGWMQNVSLFDGCPENLLIEVSFVVKPRSFPPMEEFISTQHMTTAMFIIRRGLVASKGRVKGAGSVFGEDVILASVPYKYTATTLTFVDTAILDRSDLEMILESFPHARRMLHRRAKRTSIRERMIVFSKAVKAMSEKLHDDRLLAAELEEKQKKEAKAKAKAAERGGNTNALLPPLDRGALDIITPVGALPGTIDECVREGGDDGEDYDWGEDDGDVGEGEEDGGGGVGGRGGGGGRGEFAGVAPGGFDAHESAMMAAPKRRFFDFDSSEEMLLPYGGLLNVMMFADERYRNDVERSATKIQALFRGSRARRKLKEDINRKMEILREQIADEQINTRMRQKILVEDGLLTAEEAAAAQLGTPNAVAGVHGAAPKLAGGMSQRSLSIIPTQSSGPAISTELEKMIRDTATRVDKLAEEQKLIFNKVAEMYKVVLKGSGSVG